MEDAIIAAVRDAIERGEEDVLARAVATVLRAHADRYDEGTALRVLFDPGVSVTAISLARLDPDAMDDDGETALHRAACSGNCDVIRVLPRGPSGPERPGSRGQDSFARGCPRGLHRGRRSTAGRRQVPLPGALYRRCQSSSGCGSRSERAGHRREHFGQRRRDSSALRCQIWPRSGREGSLGGPSRPHRTGREGRDCSALGCSSEPRRDRQDPLEGRFRPERKRLPRRNSPALCCRQRPKRSHRHSHPGRSTSRRRG